MSKAEATKCVKTAVHLYERQYTVEKREQCVESTTYAADCVEHMSVAKLDDGPLNGQPGTQRRQ